MADIKIGILEPHDFSPKAFEILKKLGSISCYDKEELGSFLIDKNVLFVRLKYFISKEFLDNCPNLEIICTPTTGLNHLDLDELKRRGILVLSLKEEAEFLSKIRATPEHIFGLTISLLRNYKKAFLNENNRDWNRDLFRGEEIYGNSIGIIGFGRVGKILTRYFSCFEAKVFYYDIQEIEEQFGAKKIKSIEEVIKASNIIILCASFEETNYQFFDKRYFDMMKDKYFINAARGELIDEEYLLTKINENYFKGVALDVIKDETKAKNNLGSFLNLTNNHNFILTPHIGGATFQSMWETEVFIAQKLLNLISGKP